MPSPVCPAADPLAGPPIGGPSVVCRVMKAEDEMADGITEGTQPGRHITALHDPSTLYGFCCGTAIGRVTGEDAEGPRANYTFCPVWEAFVKLREQHRADASRVFEFPERPKLLGRDPEVEADILGVDVEQVIAIRKKRSAGISPKLLRGEQAARDLVENWKREEGVAA